MIQTLGASSGSQPQEGTWVPHAPDKQAGSLSICHTGLHAPGPGTGGRVEKQLFLATVEEEMTSACAGNHGGLFGGGDGQGVFRKEGSRNGGRALGELLYAGCLGLGEGREAASGSRGQQRGAGVGFLMASLHTARLCWVPSETQGGPQRQPHLQAPCGAAGKTGHFCHPNTIMKSWGH